MDSEAPTLSDAPASAGATALTLTGEPGRSSPPAHTGPKEIGGYRILRELGAGGMGAVYEAFETKMNRRVALKVLSRHISESEKAGDRFAREAWIAGKLNHPNLVRVFERGEEADISFYTMELVDGGSLYDVVKTLRAWGKDEKWGLAFGSREYLSWAIGQVVQAARGLEYAHRQGVVHRDIKPMNILLSRDPPGVKVADFGLAVDLGATRMTTVGKVMGTVAYMAPEQIRGQSERIGPHTDVYALGVTLFEMLTLELPFSGETQQLYMNAVLTLEARKPRKVNERVGRDLETVLQKALEKDPQDRYASAGAFADDLENVLHFRPIGARPPGTMVRLGKWARRRPMHAALAGVLLVGIPVTGFLSLRAIQHRRLVLHLQVEGWRNQAMRLIHDNRFEAALDPLGKVLAVTGGDLDALRYRSLSYARLAMVESEPAKRDSLRQNALADIDRVMAIIPQVRWPYRVRAYLLKSFGRDQQAAEDEAKAVRLAEAVPAYLEVQIDGILALLAGNDQLALDRFNELIRRRPDAAEERLWRASIYDDMGDRPRAITDYEVAAALKPSDVLSRLNLARLKTLAGAYEEAAALYLKVKELEPQNARAYEGMSANLLAQGRAKGSAGDSRGAAGLFAQAAEQAERALALDPSLIWARINQGASLMEQNRLRTEPDGEQIAKAVALYANAIQRLEAAKVGGQDPAYQSALENQCDALIQAKKLEEALVTCRKIAGLQPDSPNAQYNLAGALALSGRSAEALRALEEDFRLGDRDWTYLASDRWFVTLHPQARFQALLERMKREPTPPKP